MKKLIVASVVAACSASVAAQWPKFPDPTVPRDAKGAINYDAPTPRTPDGKPDFAGIWMRSESGPPRGNRGNRGGPGAGRAGEAGRAGDRGQNAGGATQPENAVERETRRHRRTATKPRHCLGQEARLRRCAAACRSKA